MPKEKPLHYRVPDDHPGIIEGSMFRPVTCNRHALFLEEHNQKGPGEQYRLGRGAKLGFNYQSTEQRYYTNDRERVTCKMCLKILKARGE